MDNNSSTTVATPVASLNNINPNPPVPVVKKVFKFKKKRSLLSFLVITILFLVLTLFICGIVSVSIWLHTFSVFTQEKTIGELTVSKLTIKDGKPTFTVRYEPYDDVSGFWGIFGSDKDSKNNSQVVEREFTGDRIFIDADFIRWNNWVTFLGFKPVYKINRIKADFTDLEHDDDYDATAIDLNGGPSEFAKDLQRNESKFEWVAQSVDISSRGKYVQDAEMVYLVKVTEDGLILEEK